MSFGIAASELSGALSAQVMLWVLVSASRFRSCGVPPQSVWGLAWCVTPPKPAQHTGGLQQVRFDILQQYKVKAFDSLQFS